jgi:hypothetical protein
MPIPAFDGILGVLPPHVGDPRKREDLSPYACSVAELCDRFATSAKRKQILDGFVKLRAELFALGIQGFHWLDGSFLEDIETQEGRDPNDIDAITFVTDPAMPGELNLRLINPRPDLWIPAQTKATYFVDHYLVSLGSAPLNIVADTKYWYALFSHRRDGVWKGMLEVKLTDKGDDDAARIVLGRKP